MQDAGNRMPDARCQIPDVGYRIQDTGSRLQDSRCRNCYDDGCTPLNRAFRKGHRTKMMDIVPKLCVFA